MSNTKKMTIKYWKSLSKDSKKRALMQCFGAQPGLVRIMLTEVPTPGHGLWKIAFDKIKQTEVGNHYKTCVHGCFIP